MRILLLLLALTACANPDTRTIRLSSHVTATYDFFRSLPDEGFFAASVDGLFAGYSYCPEPFNCSSNNSRYLALGACQSQTKRTSAKPECVIIANSHRIVWSGEVVFYR